MTSLSDSLMAEAATLLAVMREIGLHVRLDDGGQLRVGPQAMLAPYDVEYIRETKPALIALLAAEQSGMGIDTTPAEKMQHRANMAPSRVTCGDCLHFMPGQPLPGESLGACSLTGTGPPSVQHGDYAACYPLAPRACPSYKGIKS